MENSQKNKSVKTPKASKVWYHENWRRDAYNSLNTICVRIGCTYSGGNGEDRKCTIKHFDCGLLRELTS